MKTLKTLTLMAVVATLLFACEDPFKDEIESKDFLKGARSSIQLGSPGFELGPDGEIIRLDSDETPNTDRADKIIELTE